MSSSSDGDDVVAKTLPPKEHLSLPFAAHALYCAETFAASAEAIVARE